MTPTRFTLARKICRTMPPILSQSLRNLIFPINVARRNDFTFTGVSQTGSKLTNKISDSQAYRFSIHGYHEWRNLAIAIALSNTGDTIVEIGAHIGTETIGFSDIVGPSGRVFAFEPLPANLISLRKNLSNAQYGNSTVFDYAVGNEVKKVRFTIPLPKESSGLSHIVADIEKPASDTIEVDCVTLDSMADSIGAAKIIFTDAEGADLAILKGGKNYIQNHLPSIVLECYPRFLSRSGSTVKDLYDTVNDLGYVAFEISKMGLKPIKSVENYSKVSNWLIVHSSNIEDAALADRYIKICGLRPCIPGMNPISMRPAVSNGFTNSP